MKRIWIFGALAAAVISAALWLPDLLRPPVDARAPASGEAPAPAAKVVRPSALAGSWYEGTKEALEKQVKGYLASAKAPADAMRRVGALVAPHAGYRYAGRSQGDCYKTVEGARYDRVIILGPSHHTGFRGISIAPVTHYQTPLGEVPLDLDLVKEMQALPIFRADLPAAAHGREHSIEIQLPFLQAAIGAFRLVPILVGEIGPRERNVAATALRTRLDDRTLLVASSDFTHYGERFGFLPFPESEAKAGLEKLDLGAAKLATAGDTEGFVRYVQETQASICGARPISILLAALPQGSSGELLSYTTSAGITGEQAESVSYVSLAFRFEGIRAEAAGALLSAEEMARLVAIARFSLEQGVRTGEPPPEADLRAKFPFTARLQERRGVFVTLKVRGDLRGCIGMIFPEEPLASATSKIAVAAALHDSRFQPVRPEELSAIDVEVSALTPPKPIAGPGEIRVGLDGVVLRKGGASAVFLPQVATEQGWDRDTMLSHLARKAGLSADAWKSGASFLTFQAEIGHEVWAPRRG